MNSPEKELRYFVNRQGSAPAEVWLNELRDRKGAAVIRARLDRVTEFISANMDQN